MKYENRPLRQRFENLNVYNRFDVAICVDSDQRATSINEGTRHRRNARRGKIAADRKILAAVAITLDYIHSIVSDTLAIGNAVRG